MSSADYYREGAERMKSDRQRIAEIETLLADKFARWEVLELFANQRQLSAICASQSVAARRSSRPDGARSTHGSRITARLCGCVRHRT